MFLRGVRVALGLEHAQGGDEFGAGGAALAWPRCASGEIVYRRGLDGRRPALQQRFDSTNGFRFEEDIPALATRFGGHMFDDHNFPPVSNSVDDGFLFVNSRASFNTAFHGSRLLSVGDSHLGGFDS